MCAPRRFLYVCIKLLLLQDFRIPRKKGAAERFSLNVNMYDRLYQQGLKHTHLGCGCLYCMHALDDDNGAYTAE